MMDNDYFDWKPDKVKLESELILDDDVITDADFKTPYLETSQNTSYETFTEQSSAVPEKSGFHLVYGLLSIQEPAACSDQDITNETAEDPAPSSAPFLESSQNASNETSIEQSSTILGKFELHLVHGVPSMFEPGTSTSKGVVNGMVKIKEEMSEDPILSLEHSTVPHSSPEALHQRNCEFTDDRINIQMEDNSAHESIVTTSDPLKLDSMETNQEKESYPLSAYELYSGYDSDINSPCTAKSMKKRPPSTSRKKHFAEKGILNKNSLIPSSEKIYTIDKFFTQFKREELTRHCVTHSDVRPFSCYVCKARFKTHNHLSRHFSNHSRKKVFACLQCPARFTTKSNLNHHLLIHSCRNGLFCDKCSASFNGRSSFMRHLLNHSKEKAYSCA